MCTTTKRRQLPRSAHEPGTTLDTLPKGGGRPRDLTCRRSRPRPIAQSAIPACDSPCAVALYSPPDTALSSPLPPAASDAATPPPHRQSVPFAAHPPDLADQ